MNVGRKVVDDAAVDTELILDDAGGDDLRRAGGITRIGGGRFVDPVEEDARDARAGEDIEGPEDDL